MDNMIAFRLRFKSKLLHRKNNKNKNELRVNINKDLKNEITNITCFFIIYILIFLSTLREKDRIDYEAILVKTCFVKERINIISGDATHDQMKAQSKYFWKNEKKIAREHQWSP